MNQNEVLIDFESLIFASNTASHSTDLFKFTNRGMSSERCSCNRLNAEISKSNRLFWLISRDFKVASTIIRLSLIIYKDYNMICPVLKKYGQHKNDVLVTSANAVRHWVILGELSRKKSFILVFTCSEVHSCIMNIIL